MFSIRYSFYLELFIVHEVYSRLEALFTDLVNVSLKMTVHVLNAQAVYLNNERVSFIVE